MGLEQLRYCDLCGGHIGKKKHAKLTVPVEAPPKSDEQASAEKTYLFGYPVLFTGEAQASYDICMECARALIVRAHEHSEAARRRLAKRLAKKQAAIDAAALAK